MLRTITFLIALLACADSATAMGPLETLRSRDLQIRELLGEREEKPGAEEDARLRTLVGSIVDFEGHTRESFGIYWYELGEADRREALRLVTILLERSLWDKVWKHRSDRIQYVSENIESADPAKATVHSRITRDEESWEVLYRMRLNGTQWRIVDIMLQGVSSVERNRSTFYKEIRRSGLPGLFEKLRKKAAGTP